MAEDDTNTSEPWYSVKLLFAWYVENPLVPSRYEERIVLIRASSFDDAINQAEEEAEKYCRDASVRIQYLDFADAYRLHASKLGHRIEVYSTLRVSTLEPAEYLDRYYPDDDDQSINRNGPSASRP